MLVRDIHTVDWQLSISSPNTLVEDEEDVRQCIEVILKTGKGEDPLRPHFGSGLIDWVDTPNVRSIANMKKEIIEAIARWEPRVILKKITHKIDLGQVIFNLYFLTKENNKEHLFSFSTESLSQEIAPFYLKAVYNPNAFRFFVHLELNGQNAEPHPPVSGFSSIVNLINWVRNNWAWVGSWFQVENLNTLIAYIPRYIANTGSLNIVSFNNVLTADIPSLLFDQYYLIDFKDADNNRIQPFNNTDILTAQEILDFVSTNYSTYGTWSIENNKLVLTGDTIDLSNYSLNIVADEISSGFDLGFNLGFNS